MAYKNPSDPRALEQRRAHYYKNKESYIARAKKLREEMVMYVRQAKDVPCSDCNNRFPHYVMDFDHRDQLTKLNKISNMVSQGNWKKLKNEISKCDVVCANCHRERTAKSLGWK